MATYKVTGYQEYQKFYDENSYYSAINYITDPEKAVYIGGNVHSIQTAASEMEQLAYLHHKEKGKKVRHSILAFAPHEHITPEMAHLFAEQIIVHYTPTNQIVYAVHGNTDNTHIHFVMNQIGFDGQRYQGKKKDYYDFNHHMHCVTGLPIIPVK